MKESTKKRKKYIPYFNERLFYVWSLALIFGPVAVQSILYIGMCLSCGYCIDGYLPWVCIAVLLAPGTAIMHWTLKRMIKEETGDLRAVIEKENAKTPDDRRIKNFYLFPDKIVWISLPVAVVYLFPICFSSLIQLDPVIALNLLLVPVSCYLILFAVFSVAGSNAIEKIGQFIPPITSPSKITGSLSDILCKQTTLILGGFAIILNSLLALACIDSADKSRLLTYSVVFSFAVLAGCIGVIYYLVKVTGRDLKKIGSYFDALFNIESDKTISGIKVIIPSRLPIKEVKRLWVYTKDVMGRISEMRRLQAEAIEGMVQNQKVKTLFLASMSHDLKSPLNSIIGFSELLLKGIEGEMNEEQREDIQIIHDSGEELLSIINNVLDYARLEAGTLEIHKEWTPSVELVMGIVKSGGHLIGRKGINIQTEIQPGMPPVFVDPARISQVLTSLISNAVKFMDKGSITVNVYQALGLFEENDKYLRIDVIDSGMGIKQIDLEKIFDSFKQVDSSFSRRSSGLGLGLSLSKELIELHNGKIWVESEIGRGSIFSLGISMKSVS